MKTLAQILLTVWVAWQLPAAEIHDAVQKGDAAKVAALLQKDAKLLQEKNADGNQALHLAAERGDAEMITQLINAGAEVNAKGANGWTPLHYAGASDSKDACLALLEKGADRSALNDASQNPAQTARVFTKHVIQQYNPQMPGVDKLFTAIAAGELDTIKALVAANPKIVHARNLSGDSPLDLAVKSSLDIVRTLLAAGADVNAKDATDTTPLHLAAKGDSDEITLALLGAGANVNAQDKAGYAPLHNAAEEEKIGQVVLLLKHGAKPDLASANGSSPLLIAAMQGGNVAIMNLLLKAGAKPGTVAENGFNALHCAAAGGYPKAVRLMLDQGIPVNERSRLTGRSALALAAAGPAGQQMVLPEHMKLNGMADKGWKAKGSDAHYFQVVELLIGAGAEVNSVDDVIGATPLHAAAQFGQLKTAQLLLDKGAKVNARTGDSRTPLHFAAGSASTEMITLLLDQGADIDAVQEKHPSQSTPLAWAVQFGKIDNLKLLLKRGANLKATFFSMGATALHYAAMNRQVESAQALIEAGLEVNAPDKVGSTPLMVAVMSGALEVVKLLIEKGADLNAKGQGGLTPLMVAARMNNAAMVSLLKASEQNPSAMQR